MKKVLITGGAGFIGSHTADLLLKSGYQVRILDNLSPPVHRVGGSWPAYLDPKIEKIKGDVRYPAHLLKALKGVSAVIHLAAFQDLVPQFSKFFRTNATSTALIYELIVKHKLPIERVVVASSQFVYGEGRAKCSVHGEIQAKPRKLSRLTSGHWEPTCPICNRETKPLPLLETRADPQNQYSISKYTQELIALRLGRLWGVPSVALRYSIVQGSRQSYRNAYSGVLRLFTLALMQNRPITIYEDGQQLRDYVNVADVAAANLIALEQPKAVGEVYNVGDGRGYTVMEFAKVVAKVLGKKFDYKMPGSFRVGDTRHSVSDIAKLKKLGWRPTKTPEQSVTEYYHWLRGEKLDQDYLKLAEQQLKKLGTVRQASIKNS